MRARKKDKMRKANNKQKTSEIKKESCGTHPIHCLVMWVLHAFFCSTLNIGIVHSAREAEGRRVPVNRLVNQSKLAATTAAAVLSLGLRAVGICFHQSEHPKYSSQLKQYTLPLLRYVVILFITAKHLLWRGIPLAECTMPFCL